MNNQELLQKAIIALLREAGAETDQQLLNALEDGELLARLGIDDQLTVECLHDALKA